MTTDFYQRQSDARRSTWRLVVLFGIAVVLIMSSVVAITFVAVDFQYQRTNRRPESQIYVIPAIAGLVSLLIIVGGSLFKVWELRHGGGMRVAEGLGGRRIYPGTSVGVERRLMNVVEEMAIASGVPVPPVFLLDEDGINAFAAGYSPSDAVLGITRGCAENLSRDELQGVIAHEFSHILNGDMRMSIKLIGILHGILLIGLVGQVLLRTFVYAGHGRSGSSGGSGGSGGKGGGGQIILVILAVSVAAIVLGFIGTFFGNLIKAAVSRQREYLADASAVQFTRDPGGIAGALKRIGGSTAGSQLEAPNAAEMSHMYFAEGVWQGIAGLWATHPPLPKRIRAIEPNWDGKFYKGRPSAKSFSSGQSAGFAGAASKATGAASAAGAAAGDAAQDAGEVPISLIDEAYLHVGDPTTEHQHYAAEVIKQLDGVVLETVREPYGARAVVYGLLLDEQPEIRKVQMDTLQQHATPDVVKLVVELQDSIDGLDIRARLPLIDLALPSLKAMSMKQYQDFRHCFVSLAKADRQINLFEWMLAQVVMRHLQPQFDVVKSPPVQYYGMQRLQSECATLLSTVASAGNSEERAAEAFEAGAQLLPELRLKRVPRKECHLAGLQDVLAKLDRVSAKHRGRLVDACAAAICADGHVTWQEAELLRGISDLLDCPMPPLLVKKTNT
ncbi:MAG: M48 family metallopeptidase [Rubripirellula sp.]|jgi:Zn-dependent protease with chaperone function|nr:M48 family metallopeptidase [Rubripirellula sp.]